MTDETNPWQTHRSEVIYTNPWIEVTEHAVTRPDSSPGIYGTVHFKNLAIGVIPIDGDGYTWLVGQWRYPLDRYSWEIPEGGGDRAIDPTESARRELKEETGIEAADLTPILEMDMSNSVTDERCIVFLATGLSFGEPEPEGTERLAIRRLPFAEAYEMVLRGEITDSIAVAGILRLQLMLSEGTLKS